MDKFEDLVPEGRAQRPSRRTIPASMLPDACCGLRSRGRYPALRAWLNVCFAPKATSLLRGSENDALCHFRTHAPQLGLRAQRCRTPIARFAKPSRSAITVIM